MPMPKGDFLPNPGSLRSLDPDRDKDQVTAHLGFTPRTVWTAVLVTQGLETRRLWDLRVSGGHRVMELAGGPRS